MAPRLVSRDVQGVAAYLASDACQKVVVLTGAGVSCAAGIPDFRSPGGMYDTLRPELITASPQERAAMARDPTCVVLKDMFLQNQFPYHEVRRPFILGTQRQQWKATLFHRFLEVLDNKGKLLRLVTQNIDGLDFQTNISPDRICACHGSVGRAACEGCGAPVDFDEFCHKVRTSIKDIYGVDADAPSEASASDSSDSAASGPIASDVPGRGRGRGGRGRGLGAGASRGAGRPGLSAPPVGKGRGRHRANA